MFRLKPTLILIGISLAMNKLILWKAAEFPLRENMLTISLFATFSALGGEEKLLWLWCQLNFFGLNKPKIIFPIFTKIFYPS